MAKPVTSPDSARATEPRRPEATLELRRGTRGARFGKGAGERERVRVRGEEALCDAERSKEAATSRQGEGAEPDAADAAGTAEARGELETGDAAPRRTYLGLEPHLPASKGCWCTEFVKMKIRNPQSLLVCSIIL